MSRICETIGTFCPKALDYQIKITISHFERRTILSLLTVTFPESAVLFLRHDKNTPVVMRIKIVTPGGSIEYDVKTIKMQDYSLGEIFEKNLLLLIPFYIFTYQKELSKYNTDTDKLKKLKDEYVKIVEHLEELKNHGIIKEYTEKTILEMSKRVLNNLAKKYKNVKEGVGTFVSALTDDEIHEIEDEILCTK